MLVYNLYVCTVMFLVQDFFFSIGFIAAFSIPLKKLREAVSENLPNENYHDKFMYAAVKTSTLTIIALSSTAIMLVIFFVFRFDLAWVDMVVNSVCLLLMTPYYDDAVYYRNVCWLCIKICTPSEHVYKPGETADTKKETMNGGDQDYDDLRSGIKCLFEFFDLGTN